jgi:hypothetical protein
MDHLVNLYDSFLPITTKIANFARIWLESH